MRRRDVLGLALAAAVGRVAGADGHDKDPVVRMEQVIAALSLGGDLNRGVRPGATPEMLAEAERRLGRPLPAELGELYATFDGGVFVFSTFHLLPLLPLSGGDLAFRSAGDLLRSWRWPVPPELFVFADNGSESSYGVWLSGPDTGIAPLVVEMGEDFDPGAFAVVGDHPAGFVAGHCAYYLLSIGMDGYPLEPALDALGVPADLRAWFSATGDDYLRLLNWANRNLPDKTPDPYMRGLTPDEIDESSRRRSV